MKPEHRLALRRERRRLRRIQVKQSRRKAKLSQIERAQLVAPKRFIPELGRKIRVLTAPSSINLSDGYTETANFLRDIRLVAGELHGKFHVDLTGVLDITPAGALLLVAAFDQWRQMVPGGRLKPSTLHKWNPRVRRKLKDMGFFEVLNTRCPIEDEIDPTDDRYLPFLTGFGSEGDQAKALRQKIEELGPELADRSALYDGLVEAMTNVKQHAYDPTAKVRRWWMSASVNVQNNKLTVMFLDHGAGIPATLPRSRVWEQARGWLARAGADALKDDARMIQAALSIEKSRTGDEYRGNGLRQDIRGYVESHSALGRLRILSRRGKCVYEKSSGGEEVFSTDGLNVPLVGTFLEWTIEEYSANEAQD